MMTVTLTLDDVKKLVTLAGFTPSAGSWEDDEKVFAFSVESHGPATYGHPRFALQYSKTTGELLRDNRPYYPGTYGERGRGPESVTTEDLIATCQNYPETIDARVAAIVLERRVGANAWTAAVARRIASKYKYFTWTLGEGTREHASADAQREHWATISSDPRARYWREEPAAAGKPEGACKWWLNCTRPATTTREHPVLGQVPICAECNAKVERLSPAVSDAR